MYPNVNSVKLKVQLPVSSVRPAYHCWDSLTSWRRCINWSCSKVGSQWGILSWKLVQSIGPGLLVRVWGTSNNSFLQNEKDLFSIVLPNSYTIVYRYFFFHFGFTLAVMELPIIQIKQIKGPQKRCELLPGNTTVTTKFPNNLEKEGARQMFGSKVLILKCCTNLNTDPLLTGTRKALVSGVIASLFSSLSPE